MKMIGNIYTHVGIRIGEIKSPYGFKIGSLVVSTKIKYKLSLSCQTTAVFLKGLAKSFLFP